MKKQLIFCITTVIIWATLAPVVKSLLTEIPNLEALSVSSFFAFAFLLIINIISGHIKVIRSYTCSQLVKMAGLGFIGLFLYSALYYQGLAWIGAQDACILNYLWPIMLVVFSVIILKEKMTLKKGLAMICSFIGIIILSLGMEGGQSANKTGGIICCVLAAACYGLFSVLNKKADYDQNITMTVIWLTVAVCAALSGAMLESWVPVSGIQLIGLLWLGIFVDAVAYLLWALALKGSENTASIANLAYLTPFLSVIFSAVFLGEKIHLQSVAALLFIVGGIAVQSIGARHGK